LRTIARRAITRDRLEAIALAGTDLAVAFDESSAGFAAIDCARVHIDAIVKAMMG
jgi:aspartate racemase